jgi:hypothetical protein
MERGRAMSGTNAEYMREYRARHGGSAPADRARSRANAAAAKWVNDNHPEVYAELLAEARSSLGLSLLTGPSGNFRSGFAHGTETGYKMHYRNGEKPCDACRTEYNARARERYAEKAARATP